MWKALTLAVDVRYTKTTVEFFGLAKSNKTKHWHNLLYLFYYY